MGNLLSSNPKLEITDVDRAVLSLKTQRRRLEDHRTRVMSQINREKVIARELVATGHKDRAILALKKKRLQETTLIKLDAWLLNVESMLTDVEMTKDQVRVMETLKQGNEANKLMQKAVALEDVEKLMEETAEAKEYQDQLRQALGESWTGEDEAATEAELADLEDKLALEIAAELPKVPSTKVAVGVPPIAVGKVEEEKEEEKVEKEPVAVAVEVEEEELPSVPTHLPVVAPAKVNKVEERDEEALIPAS